MPARSLWNSWCLYPGCNRVTTVNLWSLHNQTSLHDEGLGNYAFETSLMHMHIPGFLEKCYWKDYSLFYLPYPRNTHQINSYLYYMYFPHFKFLLAIARTERDTFISTQGITHKLWQTKKQNQGRLALRGEVNKTKQNCKWKNISKNLNNLPLVDLWWKI